MSFPSIRSACAGALALALCLAPALGARADEFTPSQKDAIGEVVRAYLIEHPEVLRDAMKALDAKESAAVAAAQQKILGDPQSPVFASQYQANVGDPQGKTTLVEFFDYNCHFCKGALTDIAHLMKDDPKLRLVLKDFPVLGTGSVEAAKVAIAVRNQLPGDKFWAFHAKLLATQGPVGKDEALAVAKELKLDMAKLQKDIDDPKIADGIQETLKMADSLQISGTPSFVVGQEVVVGAVGYDQLKQKLDSVRQCGHAAC
jgi:protein-disulfide isomerase